MNGGGNNGCLGFIGCAFMACLFVFVLLILCNIFLLFDYLLK